MPIAIEKAVGSSLPGISYTWSVDDVILYNLGVGAGDPPTDERELRYAYEADLRVIPSFGTIPPFDMMMSMGLVDGIDIDLAQVLHGDQKIVVHSEIPSSGSVDQTGRVIDVYDKGRGALIVMEMISVDTKTGQRLFTNRSGIYVRGEGGFGGDSGPPAANTPPERDPDLTTESKTLPQQALLYRMVSGDKNPLHAEPGFARLAGFDRPILHGLCTYGVVLKAVVDTALEGESDQVGSYDARFSGHVFPGETLVTKIWEESEALFVAAATKERGTTVLSNAVVRTR